MHVQIWHKLENNGQVQHSNEGLLHSSADKTRAQENRGKARMHDQRDVRRRVLPVQLAQTLRQVKIEACDERNSRGTGKPSRGDPRNGNTQHEGKGGNDPGHFDLLGHVTDPLNDALQDADILLADGQKQRQSCPEIQRTREKASPSNGARKRSPRSEEHTSELQSHLNLVCRLLLEKKKQITNTELKIWYMALSPLV